MSPFPRILTINGGSSSIKFALFEGGGGPARLLDGIVERIGLPGASLSFRDGEKKETGIVPIEAPDHRSAARFLIGWLEERVDFRAVKGVGHRIVHGMDRPGPEPLTPKLLLELREISPWDPEHMPSEISIAEEFHLRWPKLFQLGCFDTSFHRTMPRVAELLPVPRRFYSDGLKRYGFHGLSCSFIMEELGRLAGKESLGRVVIAHLGNGASMTAVKDGESVETSMGFTPAGGIVMGTRPGDLDPGAAWFMMTAETLTSKRFSFLMNHESGLLGVSETSSDLRDLLAAQERDTRAAEAVDLFCYQARKYLGSLAAVLGGIDVLVFTGGIGCNSPEVRRRICEGLEFLGIEIDGEENEAGAAVISRREGRVSVRVMKTDEEIVIARALFERLK